MIIQWGKYKWVIAGAAAIILGAIAILLYFLLKPSNIEQFVEKYSKEAVATNGILCSEIGVNILKKNGSAVEAAIAALFCEGVINLQSMGIGGGFLMTIYNRQNQTARSLIAREVAPLGATENMFKGNSTKSQYGGLAAGVPGELKGYWEAYQMYSSGYVTWSDLVQPTIEICENGFEIQSNLAKVLALKEEDIKRSPSLSDILINPETNHVWKEGDKLKRPKLAETLKKIASEGVQAFYNGSIGDDFVTDVKDLGGIITKEDLQRYQVRWEEPIVAHLQNNVTLHTAPLPGSGTILTFILNVLDTFIPANDEVKTYQRIIEAIKHAYGHRTELGDPYFEEGVMQLVANLTSKDYALKIRQIIRDNFTSDDPSYYGADIAQPEDHGTANICVLAANGDAVAVTSTINLLFGSMSRSVKTGIIINNQMDDFSSLNITNAFGVPPSPTNFIKPGKRPLSSMSPSIFVDTKGDVRLIVGAAGGTKITTTVAQVAISNLWLNESVKSAVDKPRIHHQLFPMAVQHEKEFNKLILEGLKNIGHKLMEYSLEDSSTATAISIQDNKIFAHSDYRIHGQTSGD